MWWWLTGLSSQLLPSNSLTMPATATISTNTHTHTRQLCIYTHCHMFTHVQYMLADANTQVPIHTCWVLTPPTQYNCRHMLLLQPNKNVSPLPCKSLLWYVTLRQSMQNPKQKSLILSLQLFNWKKLSSIYCFSVFWHTQSLKIIACSFSQLNRLNKYTSRHKAAALHYNLIA